MRKRSDAGAVLSPAADRTIDMFPKQEAKPALITKTDDMELPERVSIDRGIPYIQCQGCSLIQSFGTAAGKEKIDDFGDKQIKFECISCFIDIDPDRTIDQWCHDTRYKPITKADIPQKVEASKPVSPVFVPEPAKAKKPEPLGHCDTCGKEITKTNIGFFYACGHDPRPKEEQIPARVEPVKQEPKVEKPVIPQIPKLAPMVTESQRSGVTITKLEGTVTVTLGKMTFTPKSYNTFEVGPFSASISLGAFDGDQVADAIEALIGRLYDLQEEEFRRVAKRFKSMLAELHELYEGK